MSALARLAGAAAVLSALSLAPSALAANSGVVSRTGQVGQLRIDRSSEADVRRVAGEPSRVFDFTDAGGGEARHLLYRCGRGCFTSYYIDVDGGGVLGNFGSNDRSSFRTARGTRVGMSQRAAERRERRRARDGCPPGISFMTRRVFVNVALTKARGGRVLSLHAGSIRHNVLDC